MNAATAKAVRDPHPLATMAGIYALDGRKREAQELIDDLKETARHRYVSGFFFAEAYVGLGEGDQAVTWLERAYEDCSGGLRSLQQTGV